MWTARLRDQLLRLLFRVEAPVEPEKTYVINVPEEAIFYLYNSFVPSWHADVLGPIPFGRFERLGFEINAILRPTREEAMEVCWKHIQQACEMWDHPFDPDEWDVINLLPKNAN